jgi:hypothetical protein
MVCEGWWVLRGGGLWRVYFKHFSIRAYVREFLRKTHHNPPPQPNPPPSGGVGTVFSEAQVSRDLTREAAAAGRMAAEFA